MAADVFETRSAAQSDLIRKPDFDLKLKGIGDRVTKTKTKYLQFENELKILQKFDTAYFRGKCYFEEDGTQKYLVFQPMCRYFKRIAGVGTGNYIYWSSIIMEETVIYLLMVQKYISLKQRTPRL